MTDGQDDRLRQGAEKGRSPAGVLLVEDDAPTRHLYRDTLKQAGFQVVEAGNLEQAIALMNEEIGVALLDIELAGRSGIEVLKHIRQGFPCCSAIMITAYANKGNAVAALQQGAADYLEKPIGRRELVQVVGQWLEVSRLKRENIRLQDFQAMYQAVQESEARYRQLVELSPDAIVVHDPDGHILYANPACVRMLGVAGAPELVGRNVMEFAPAASQPLLRGIREEIRSGAASRLAELQLFRSDGNSFPAELIATATHYGHQPAVQVVARDISERRETEASLAKYKLLFDEISDLAYICDGKGNILFVNEAIGTLAGHQAEELVGKPFAPLFDEQNLAVAMEVYRRTLQGESPVFELTFRDTGIQCEYHNSPFRDEAGSIIGVMGVARDITERRRMEDELRLHGEISSHIADGISLVRASDGVIVYANRKYEEMFGYAAGELDGKHISVVVAPSEEAPETITEEIVRLLKEGGEWAGEVRNIRKDGTIFWSYVTVSTFQHHQYGEVWLGLQRDITERKQFEERLRASEAQYRRLVDSSPSIIYEYSSKRGTIFCSRQAEAALGYPVEHLYNNPFLWNQSIHPDDEAAVARAIRDMQEGGSFNIEYRIRNAQGNWQWFNDYSIGRREEGDETIISGLALDITDRKQTEELIREQQEHLKTIIETSRDLVFLKDREFRYLIANSAHEPLLGRPVSEIIGKSDFDIMPADAARQCRESDELALATGELIHREEEMGGVWYEVAKLAAWDGEGNITGVVGIIRDISERKQAEQVLRNSEERYKALFEQTSDYVLVLEPRGEDIPVIVDANEAAFRKHGYSRAEMIGQPVSFIDKPLTREEALKRTRLVQAGGLVHFEAEHVCKDGTSFVADVAIQHVAIGGKSLLLSVERDISERKQAEAGINEWKNRYEAAVRASGYILYDWNSETDEVTYGGDAEKVLGYTLAELKGRLRLWAELIHPDDVNGFNEAIELLRVSKKQTELEYRVRRKNGEYIHVEDCGHFISDAHGNSVRMIGFVKDVSERVQAEETIAEQLRHIKLILQTAQDGFWEVGLDGTIQAVNDAYCRMSGYSREELKAMRIDDVEVSESPEETATHMKKVMQAGYDCFETRHRRKDGGLLDLEVSVSVADAGDKQFLAAFLRDIGERKRLENAVRESEFRFRIMADESPLAMQIFSPDGRTLHVNHAWEKLWGLTLEDLSHYNVLQDEQLVAKGTMLYLRKGFAGEVTEIPAIFYDVNANEAVPDSGKKVWVRAYIYPIVQEADGAISEVVLVQEDVTARKVAEEKLQEHTEKLERFNKLAVGREMRMVELKREINALLAELGRGEKYTIHEPKGPDDSLG